MAADTTMQPGENLNAYGERMRDAYVRGVLGEVAYMDLMCRATESVYLVRDDPREQSGHGGGPAWYRAVRMMILEAIDTPGTFLDVGCANGHLIESLSNWLAGSGLDVAFNGLEISAGLAQLARERLPAWRERIHHGDGFHWQPPCPFDYVYSMVLPDFPSGREWKRLWVWVDWPDASPQEKDQEVCRLFMDYLSTVKNLRRIRTWAHSRWTDCDLSSSADADMTLAYNQVRDRVERMRLELPDEVKDEVDIWKYNEETDNAVIWMGVSVPDGVEDKEQFLERQVQAPLERLDGVARVSFWGAFRQEIVVEVDQDRLQASGLSSYQLVQALQADNFVRAGGYISGGDKRLYVRSLASYSSLEDIGNVPLTSGDRQFRLKDVASVTRGSPPRVWRYRVDGQDGIGFDVYKESDANLVDVCRKVVDALRRSMNIAIGPTMNSAMMGGEK